MRWLPNHKLLQRFLVGWRGQLTGNGSPRHFEVAEVDGLEIISLVDNSIDFLSSANRKEVQSFRKWTKDRYGKDWTRTHLQLPFAEHGFSVLVRIFSNGKTISVLFDTGISESGVIDNSERMGLDLREVDFIVLSHGHYDHTGGLISVLKAINKPFLPLILHEDMFKKRGSINSNAAIHAYPEFPAEEKLVSAQVIKTKQPYLIANDTAMVTGEIPRETSFEKGFVQHRVFVNEEWKSDALIMDDRAIVFSVKEKGLVVISGCAHAGIINTIDYAKRISGIKDIYAVIGGFHLAGKENENRIEPTVKMLELMNPKLIAPSHCTGWRGMFAIAEALPEAFVWNSVGNLYGI